MYDQSGDGVYGGPPTLAPTFLLGHGRETEAAGCQGFLYPLMHRQLPVHSLAFQLLWKEGKFLLPSCNVKSLVIQRREVLEGEKHSPSQAIP